MLAKVPTGLVNAAFTIAVWRSCTAGAIEAAMSRNGRMRSRAGGALLAGAILAGTLAGVALGEPSIGILAGTSFGLALLGLLWWRDREDKT
jgi:hypothetical protein